MLKPIIQAKNLNVVYNEGKSNEYHASRNLTADIYPGEYIILFGPSGCGKSTLLYCIQGTLPPSSGDMFVRGDEVYKYDSKEMVNYQQNVIGMIYQSFNLIPSLSVMDNVSLPQVFASVDKIQRDKRAMELLKQFGVGHVANKLTTNLSGGQMQRVAVARSLVNNPQILLADEPVGNLDSISAEQVMDMLEDINIKEKKTVILVTHDAKYLPYAHRIYYMSDGKVDREVPNPEKAQIKKVEPGKTIVTEIEKLARMYPYSTIDELRVKSIINYLTEDFNFDQLQVLERAVEEYTKGKISEEKFFAILIAHPAEGGVGLSRAVSQVMGEKMKKIVFQAREVNHYRKAVEMDLAFYYQHKFAARLKEFLLQECGKTLDYQQEKVLEEAIADRTSGLIKRDDFEQRLLLALKDGGAGLHPKTASALSRYLEKLLAQGVSYIKGH